MTIFQSRAVLQQYAAAVATRGLIHSNSTRARFSSGGSGLGWKPLHKPQWYSVMKQVILIQLVAFYLRHMAIIQHFTCTYD